MEAGKNEGLEDDFSSSFRAVFQVPCYTPEVLTKSPWKMMLARLLSFWKGHFSGVMLNWVVVSNIFYFHPLFGEDEPILTNIFQMGWFNHQAINFRRVKNRWTTSLFLPSSSGERRNPSDLGRLWVVSELRPPHDFCRRIVVSNVSCCFSFLLRYQDTDARQDAILKSCWGGHIWWKRINKKKVAKNPSQNPMKFNDFGDCMWFTVMWDFGVGPYEKFFILPALNQSLKFLRIANWAEFSGDDQRKLFPNLAKRRDFKFPSQTND